MSLGQTTTRWVTLRGITLRSITLRPGSAASVLSCLLVAATGVLLTVTASELAGPIRGLMVTTVVIHAMVIVLGSSRLVAYTSIFILLAVTLESAISQDPSWVRSIAAGLLWYVAMEVSWHALDRRAGTIYTRAALAQRVQSVAGVLGLSLAVGLVAIAATTLAPRRSLPLQAVVLCGGLFILGGVARQLVSNGDSNASIT